jgi:hypothetical protein
MFSKHTYRYVFTALASILTMASPAIASGQNGTVYWYASDTTTSPYAFVMIGTRTAKPACATDDAWSIASPTTDGSKALLAGVMTALIGKRTISVIGAGTCDPAQPAREMVQYIMFF